MIRQSSEGIAARDGRRSTVAAAALCVFFAAWCSATISVWNARTQPIFAHRPHPVTAQAVLYSYPAPDDDLLTAIPADCPLFWAAKFALAGGGVTYARVAGGQAAMIGLLVLMIAAIAGSVGGPWAAGAAAAFVAATPVFHLAALGFDDHLTLVLFTAIGLAFLVRPRPFERVLPVIGAAAAITAILRFAFLSSSGLIAVSVVLACAGVRFIQELVDVAPIRRKTAIARMGVGLIVMAVFIGIFARRDGTFEYLAPSYLGAEAGHAPPGLLRNILAYPYLMARYHLGPIVATFAAIGIYRAVSDKNKTAVALVAAWLVPLCVLAVIPKKNPYYIFSLLVAAPVLGAVALSRIQSPRARVVAGVLIAIGIGCVQWGLWRGDPEARPAAGFEEYIHEPTSFALHRPVETGYPDEAEARRIVDGLREIGVNAPATILVPDSVAVLDELRYFLLAIDPGWRLFVVEPAAHPPMREPIAVLRSANGADTRSVADALNASAVRIETEAGSGADPGARVEFLRRLASEVTEWRRVYTSDRYVVDVPEFLAAAPAAVAGP